MSSKWELDDGIESIKSAWQREHTARTILEKTLENIGAENVKLHERVNELEELEEDKRYIPQEWYQLAMTENAKLRELVRLMWKPFCWAQSGCEVCLTDEQDAEIRDKARELGVEVDAE